jgi:hypothetical protein
MSIAHLRTRDGSLCGRPIYTFNHSADLQDIDCKFCNRKLRALAITEADAADERRRLARVTAACDALGVRHLWDELTAIDTSHGRLLRGTLAAVVLYIAETRDVGRAVA